MTKPTIKTFSEITPLIYSWTTPDVPKYDGWEKIGYTEQETADARIAQQASQLSVEKVKLWSRRALFTSEAGGAFTDVDFHAFLKQHGIEREVSPKRTEWHRFKGAAKSSLEYFNDFAGQDYTGMARSDEPSDYQLRPEQQAAVDLAVAAFADGHDAVLWNAKPRFGKTLTTYHLMRTLDLQKVLIVTNRPAIANSWYDDFTRFIGHQTTYQFVSESLSLANRSPMTRDQWRTFSLEHQDEDPRIVEFVSLQDLKGSKYFGGSIDKLKEITGTTWDLLVIDEAHEGVDTFKTNVAFDQIKRDRTLHLSGTPFKALAAGKFGTDQIYNWTYEDEQTARENWVDNGEENPYARLPKLNLFTYQMSRMISDRLSEGVAIDEDEANIDYAFDLGEFFATKDNGYFVHESEIRTFLDRLTTNEKYPFSTPELRDEIRHSFWLLDRVASAKALERILKNHEVFQDYTVILAAGDGRSFDAEATDAAATGASLDRVRSAIATAEATGGKTITLSVGQLTTGVTVPEWTAVIMLSNMASPAQYMQAAFRAQNPCTFERTGHLYQKQNAYIFDFAPERTLTIYDKFASDLNPQPTYDRLARQESIRTLLNFFPVIGEDAEGKMVELDASQVLTFPQVFKAREVVRRGFLSNLLFENVSGIFRYPEHVKAILDKLPTADQGKVKTGTSIQLPVPPPVVDETGTAQVDFEMVINPKVAELGQPVWSVEDVPSVNSEDKVAVTAKKIATAVTEQLRPTRAALQAEYDLTAKQVERDEKNTEQTVRAKVERALAERTIMQHHLEDEMKAAATEDQFHALEAKKAEQEKAFERSLVAIYQETMESVVPEIVEREERKKEQKRANTAMDDVRSHLRGFARTIPMFLMAYGKPEISLSNFDDHTPDDVFEEVTGITEEEFRLLRDGQTITEPDGTVVTVPGLFDEEVFDQSIQEFLTKKAELADYFDDAQTETIFAYVPQQKTSLVFTPPAVVKLMVDTLETKNPGLFSDPEKTFADLFSTAGLFLMEIVRRLHSGLADAIPDEDERLKHILTSQIFEMSHNKILHEITLQAVSGGVPERQEWIHASGHFVVGDLSAMTAEERERAIDDMLTEGH